MLVVRSTDGTPVAMFRVTKLALALSSLQSALVKSGVSFLILVNNPCKSPRIQTERSINFIGICEAVKAARRIDKLSTVVLRLVHDGSFAPFSIELLVTRW